MLKSVIELARYQEGPSLTSSPGARDHGRGLT